MTFKDSLFSFWDYLNQHQVSLKAWLLVGLVGLAQVKPNKPKVTVDKSHKLHSKVTVLLLYVPNL